LCCSVFQEFSQVVYKAFTRLLQDLYKVVTRPSPCFSYFTRCLQSSLQGLHAVFNCF